MLDRGIEDRPIEVCFAPEGGQGSARSETGTARRVDGAGMRSGEARAHLTNAERLVARRQRIGHPEQLRSAECRQVLHFHGKRTLREAFAEIDFRRPDRGVRCCSAELSRFPTVPAVKFASLAACAAQGGSNTGAAATVHLFNVMTAPPLRQRKNDDDRRHYHKLGLQAQNEPNAEPRAITAARAMTGPTIAAMTMSK